MCVIKVEKNGLTGNALEEFRKTLTSAVSDERIYIDISRANHIGSFFVNSMVWFYKEFPDAARRVVIVGVSDCFRSVLYLTGLNTLYPRICDKNEGIIFVNEQNFSQCDQTKICLY